MIPDIVAEHLEEAAYLYRRRQAALQRLDADSSEVAELGRRLRAHLDGALIGGAMAWEVIAPALDDSDESLAFVAGMLAIESGQPAWLESMVTALNAPDPAAFEGMRWACLLTASKGAPVLHARLLTSNSPWARAIGLDGLSQREKDPGSAIDRGMQSEHVVEVCAALRAASRLQRKDQVARIVGISKSEVADTAIAALKSLARLDPGLARQQCVARLQGDARVAAKAAVMLGGIGAKEDLPPLIKAARAENYELARAAMFALGQLGYTEAVPTVIDMLDRPRLGGVATLALNEICRRHQPGAQFPTVAPTDADKDGDAEDWHPDDELPRADKAAVFAWWQAGMAAVGR